MDKVCILPNNGRLSEAGNLGWLRGTWVIALQPQYRAKSKILLCPAASKGRLFFANAGKSYVVQPGRECRMSFINDLGNGSHPSPAAANGRLVGERYFHPFVLHASANWTRLP